ncbi:MAG: hypothetical protein H6548_06470 [Chitinophagales bacterium]|nr:hypothetical protein [Chitinophagales bacterium]HAE13242.1 hypothetical protein [Bacteroidota bacterium]MCB9021744.1 hypothetical protein [Chitinophagales bacterium]MCB9031005.1 hypothetical protein [Chitinophagales bacterium]HAE34668.1 hypothetical protein [Bacteroidota bacterium]
MRTETLVLIKDILIILFFLAGTLWTWGIWKLGKERQERMEFIFRNSRNRFKWLFLIGLIILIAARIFRMTAG